MIQDIKRSLLLNPAEGLQIPGFLIVKNGTIYNNDAPGPSDSKLKELIEQFSK